ncbi:CvpA family protein [Bartonella sp. DGB1]|uniref:CvpA family protein n=1 Tax=Bartonella sp. DGB1 TaxID=3239807 RepID=UPI00352382F8
MSVTFLDGAVVVIVVISGIISMLRGFSREIFSIFSWVVAALISYYGVEHLLPYIQPHISNNLIAFLITGISLFLIALIIMSLITKKLSNMVTDSRVGPVDNILGLIYGGIRGFIIALLAFMFLDKLISPINQPKWLHEASFRPFLEATSEKLYNLFPPAPEDWLEWVEKKIDEISTPQDFEHIPPEEEQ